MTQSRIQIVDPFFPTLLQSPVVPPLGLSKQLEGVVAPFELIKLVGVGALEMLVLNDFREHLDFGLFPFRIVSRLGLDQGGQLVSQEWLRFHEENFFEMVILEFALYNRRFTKSYNYL